MKIITSRTNQEIKNICLLHTKKGRVDAELYVAEGIRTISTLLEHKAQLNQLFITQEYPVPFAVPQNKITLVTPEVMHKISTGSTPSGYLALFHIPKHTAAPSPVKNGLVLANIADPGNMGTLIRTAAAFNINNIYVVAGTDPWGPKVVTASAGTIGAINILECSWNELVHMAQRPPLCALTASDGLPPEKARLANVLIVIGNEAHGIPQEWIAQCETKCTIPMPGNTESLNAAIAGAIALYCASQQEKT